MLGTGIAAAAIIASVLTVAYQVRTTRRHDIEARRAAHIASALFTIYEMWALNRRAQLLPVDVSLLRTSSAQFYSAAFRLSTMLEDEPLDALRRFMVSDLGAEDTEAMESLTLLHSVISSSLGYRSNPLPPSVLSDMFWRSRRNVPGLRLGSIDETEVVRLLQEESLKSAEKRTKGR